MIVLGGNMNGNETLKIIVTSHKEIGRCYSQTNWEIHSQFPLDDKIIMKFREMGFLGFGQEFEIIETSTRFVPERIPGEPFKPSYYIAKCYSRVDSSD